MKRRVTATDVAREAGVSQATVSYVLNNSPHAKIPEETRQRVLQAAATLSYTPSSAARALRRGRSDLVLLVLPNLPIGAALARVLEFLIDEVDKCGLSLIARREREGQGMAALWQDLQPAAVVAMHALEATEREELQAAGVLVLDTSFAQGKRGNGRLVVAQEPLGELQVRHLASRGHKRIGYAASPDGRLAPFQNPRMKGVIKTCLKLELPEPVVMEVGLDVDSAVKALRAWTTKKPRITAVCAYNDEQAFALLAGARQLELRVPQDIAVIGIDDIPMSPLAIPPLTTINLHPRVMASSIAALIAAGVAGKPAIPPAQVAGFELVIRESA